MLKRLIAAGLAASFALGSAWAAAPPAVSTPQAQSVPAGNNVTEGSPADAAYGGSGNASIVAALKGIYTALIAATPAGSAIIGKVGIDQTTAGTTNGVVVNSGALTANLGTLNGAATAANQNSTAAGTSASSAQGVQGVTGGVPVPGQAAIWYSEAVNSSVASGATFAGTTRNNTTSGSASPWGYWTVQIISNAAGTLYIRNTIFDQTSAVTANTPLTVRVPALGPSFTTLFAPSSGAATVSVFDAYSAN